MEDGIHIKMIKIKKDKKQINKELNEEASEDKNNDIEEKDIIDQVDDKSIKNFIIRFLKGIAIGIGAILPGLSGGVLAVIFGIYDPAIKFLGNIRNKFWKNVLFFIPAVIGLLLGIFLFSIVVEEAFKKYLAVFACLFIGFVVGTVPSLYKMDGEKGRKESDLIFTGVTIVILFTLMVLGQNFVINLEGSIFTWFLSGALIALGFIIPGLSPSNFLIYFGLYDKMAAGIKNIDLALIIPLALGGIISVLLFSKLMSILFKKYYSKMNHIILGLVIGSSMAIFPTVIIPEFVKIFSTTDKNISILLVLASIFLFIIGGVSTYFFSRLEDKVKK